MFYLVYISGVILLISVVLFVFSAVSFRKETKPTLDSIQSIQSRMQEEKEAINVQNENFKVKRMEIKNDLDWKKSVFTNTINELKRLPETLFKTSSKQKTNYHPR
ncbi:uncharacterized protein YoxC [Bacillus tianshenii]|uniref:Uncharacterized protein YoxC n=1 Tax=Sutcliffiella tianshenii TaxID=1463404 RepID=A0ABS2NX50_9BACI|nr:hypothetical protein [Bacillus tianshenii]MBM7619246.1 uncharacterized protein YoxC [Bacillus tianshenii]MCA1319484.1 hypothetical protein [Bacillus tianshenii]